MQRGGTDTAAAEGAVQWVSGDEALVMPLALDTLRTVRTAYDLCVTGDGLDALVAAHLLGQHLPYIKVFARVDPAQKVHPPLRSPCRSSGF
jgi:cation-transporting ATPase 13A1